jgi:hypothetical protein
MTASLPWSLLIAWSLFFGFINTHQRHAMRFRGASERYLLALQVSVLFGCLIGLALLIFYFTRVAWYWPFLLFLAGTILGGISFGVLDAKLGTRTMTMLAWIGWPAAAIWTFVAIRAVNT